MYEPVTEGEIYSTSHGFYAYADGHVYGPFKTYDEAFACLVFYSIFPESFKVSYRPKQS